MITNTFITKGTVQARRAVLAVLRWQTKQAFQGFEGAQGRGRLPGRMTGLTGRCCWAWFSWSLSQEAPSSPETLGVSAYLSQQLWTSFLPGSFWMHLLRPSLASFRRWRCPLFAVGSPCDLATSARAFQGLEEVWEPRPTSHPLTWTHSGALSKQHPQVKPIPPMRLWMIYHGYQTGYFLLCFKRLCYYYYAFGVPQTTCKQCFIRLLDIGTHILREKDKTQNKLGEEWWMTGGFPEQNAGIKRKDCSLLESIRSEHDLCQLVCWSFAWGQHGSSMVNSMISVPHCLALNFSFAAN